MIAKCDLECVYLLSKCGLCGLRTRGSILCGAFRYHSCSQSLLENTETPMTAHKNCTRAITGTSVSVHRVEYIANAERSLEAPLSRYLLGLVSEQLVYMYIAIEHLSRPLPTKRSERTLPGVGRSKLARRTRSRQKESNKVIPFVNSRTLFRKRVDREWLASSSALRLRPMLRTNDRSRVYFLRF